MIRPNFGKKFFAFVNSSNKGVSESDSLKTLENAIHFLYAGSRITPSDLNKLKGYITALPSDFIAKTYYLQELERLSGLMNEEAATSNLLSKFCQKHKLEIGFDIFVIDKGGFLGVMIPMQPGLVKVLEKSLKNLTREIVEGPYQLKKLLDKLLSNIEKYRGKTKKEMKSGEIQKPMDIVVFSSESGGKKIVDGISLRIDTLLRQAQTYQYDKGARGVALRNISELSELVNKTEMRSDIRERLQATLQQVRDLLNDQVVGELSSPRLPENPQKGSNWKSRHQGSGSSLGEKMALREQESTLTQNQEFISFLEKKERILTYDLSSRRVKGSIGDGTFIRIVWKPLIAWLKNLLETNKVDANNLSWNSIAKAMKENIDGTSKEMYMSIFLTCLLDEKTEGSWKDVWPLLEGVINAFSSLEGLYKKTHAKPPLGNIKDRFGELFSS